jgi:hypothetical protein
MYPSNNILLPEIINMLQTVVNVSVNVNVNVNVTIIINLINYTNNTFYFLNKFLVQTLYIKIVAYNLKVLQHQHFCKC